jgi:hypothetical protein
MIYKVWFNSIWNKDNKGYLYLCELCKVYHEQILHKGFDALPMPKRKTCDFGMCEVGSRLHVLALMSKDTCPKRKKS